SSTPAKASGPRSCHSSRICQPPRFWPRCFSSMFCCWSSAFVNSKAKRSVDRTVRTDSWSSGSAAIRLRIGNQTHVNKSGDRVAISPAIGPAVARVTAEALELGLATDLEAADLEPRVTAEALKSGAPTGLVAAQTEWETGICHAPRAETG